MSSPETSPPTPNATSSPASADGATPSALPDGQMIFPFGQAPAPASPSRPRASKKEAATSATFGRISLGSSASVALTSSLASRLRDLLDSAGSTEYRQTWKRLITPSGRRYWAHTASGRRTSDRDCTGWQTPNMADVRGPCKHHMERKDGGQPNLNYEARYLAGWGTPACQDARHATVSPSEAKRDPRNLRIQAHGLAGCPTPSNLGSAGEISEDLERKGEKWVNKKAGRVLQTNLATDARGLIPSSSPAATGSPAGFRLNPLFSLWLMGFPPAEWGSCGVRAMQLCRGLRRHS
jgi:hypothetical protein